MQVINMREGFQLPAIVSLCVQLSAETKFLPFRARWNMTISSSVPCKPRLLDQLRDAAQARFSRPEPVERYTQWARRYILFHGKRHPETMGHTEVAAFLQHLAKTEKDPLRALEEAHEALTFLCNDLLHLENKRGQLPQKNCQVSMNPREPSCPTDACEVSETGRRRAGGPGGVSHAKMAQWSSRALERLQNRAKTRLDYCARGLQKSGAMVEAAQWSATALPDGAL